MDYGILASPVQRACALAHEPEQQSLRNLRCEPEISSVSPNGLDSSIHRRIAGFLRWVRRVADRPTVPHLESAGSVRCVGFRVRYLHDRRALPIQFTEEFHDYLGLSGMQIASRLVGQQQRGLV